MGIVTIKDVAKKAGVSTTTVSLALNNVQGRVSDEVRQMVQEVANELGYSPNLNARNLRGSTNNLILMVYSNYYLDEQNASPMQFISNLIRSSELVGKQIVFQTIKKNADWKNELVRYNNFWNSSLFDGIIFMPSIEDNIPDSFFESLYPNYDVNLIVALPEEGEKNYPTVYAQHYWQMWQAMDKIVNKGYKSIYYICMEYGDNPPIRAKSYLDYIKKNNINGKVLKYRDFYRDKNELAELVKPYLENQSEDIAFPLWNDVDAINLLEILDFKGIQNKYRVGVIGYDDLNLSSHVTPALTTVYNPYKEMSEKALNYILKSSAYKKELPPNIGVYGHFVERDSL